MSELDRLIEVATRVYCVGLKELMEMEISAEKAEELNSENEERDIEEKVDKLMDGVVASATELIEKCRESLG